MTPLDLHPLCALFPELPDSEFDALREDIRTQGQRQPIVVLDGLILDGANRYRACIAAGVEPRFEDFTGDDLVAFVLSANLHRRHMTPGQQAAVVASVQDWAVAQRRGGDGSNQHASKCATLHICSAELKTAAQRAARSGASLRTQNMADKVARADPELARQVAHGQTSLTQALAIVKGKPRAEAPRPAAPAPSADDAGDDADAFETPADLLAEMEQEIRHLQAQVDAMKADDQRAQTLHLQRMAQVLERRCNEHLQTIQAKDREIAHLSRQLKRCAKAVGQDDPDQAARAVEAFVRQHAAARRVPA